MEDQQFPDAGPVSSDPRRRGSQPRSSALEGLLSSATGAVGTVTFLPAQALDPAGAGACAEAGEGQGAEPHVLARHNELPKTFLVGEGIARAPRAGAAHSPHAAVLGLLLLPYQLRVADRVGEIRLQAKPEEAEGNHRHDADSRGEHDGEPHGGLGQGVLGIP